MSERAFVVWLTGLSGAGKSTISTLVEKRLKNLGLRVCVLDGDVLRRGLSCDLGFSASDRSENNRRAVEVAKLLVDAGVVVITALISPFRADRELARARFPAGSFLEVFIDTPLAVAEARDPKGLYAKARRGALKGLTGVDSPYEAPSHPELRIDGANASADHGAEQIICELRLRALLTPRALVS